MNNKRHIVFILDHPLKSYRVPFFHQLHKKGFNILVIHPGELLGGLDFIKQKKSIPYLKFGGLELRRMPKFQNPDILVFMQNIRLINFWLFTLYPFRKFKLIHWGIGVSSSHGLRLQKDLTSRIRNLLATRSDALVFYSDFPLPLYSKKNRDKAFIANNTIFNPIPENLSQSQKDAFIFIGGLNKRKGLMELFHSLAEIKTKLKNEIKLLVIGEGPEKNKLLEMRKELELIHNVEFLGDVRDLQKKKSYFKRSVASISPKQAGLSILESFSFGVPFVTYKDSISGGEQFNIKNQINGFLVKDRKELTRVMIQLLENPHLAQKMGDNAYSHYINNRQMKDMVSSFEKSFEFVLSRDTKRSIP